MRPLKYIVQIAWLCCLSPSCKTVKTTGPALPPNSFISQPVPPAGADTSALANEYIRQHQRFLSGADFIGTGAEPFWSLEISLEKNMHFETADGVNLTMPAVPEIRLMDIAAGSYRYNSDSGLFNVIVYDRPCTNDMSGKVFPKTLEIDANDTRYKGCGMYLADYRLHDIWVLRSVNDSAITSIGNNQKTPVLEFNLNTNRVFLQQGCSTIDGVLQVKGHRFRIPRLTYTKPPCNENEFIGRYLALLSDKEIRYEISSLRLTLVSGITKLIYQKVD